MTRHIEFNTLDRRNLFINGDFISWPEGLGPSGFTGINTAAMTLHGYSLDSGTLSVTGTSATKPHDNCNYVHLVSTTTGEATLTGSEHSHVLIRVEGYDFIAFVGKTATLSFWVRASVAGIYSVEFKNTGRDRCYISSYVINQSNTWEYKTVTLKFDYSGGTWDYTSGEGLQVGFAQACGPTYTTSTTDQWITGNYIAVPGQVNNVATAGNTFYLAQCQLELGSFATEFEYIDVAIRDRLLKRYWQSFYNSHKQATSVGTGTGTCYVGSKYPVKMRVVPTITYSSAQIWNYNTGWRNATSTANGSIYSDRAMNILYDSGYSSYSGYWGILAAGTWKLDARL